MIPMLGSSRVQQKQGFVALACLLAFISCWLIASVPPRHIILAPPILLQPRRPLEPSSRNAAADTLASKKHQLLLSNGEAQANNLERPGSFGKPDDSVDHNPADVVKEFEKFQDHNNNNKADLRDEEDLERRERGNNLVQQQSWDSQPLRHNNNNNNNANSKKKKVQPGSNREENDEKDFDTERRGEAVEEEGEQIRGNNVKKNADKSKSSNLNSKEIKNNNHGKLKKIKKSQPSDSKTSTNNNKEIGKVEVGRAKQLDVYNKRGVPDDAETDPWKRKDQNAWALIILFQHNIDILLQAVNGFRRASDIMAANTIIVDNSLAKEALNHPLLSSIVKEIVVTPKSLNFPQLHNFMAETAFRRKLEYYFWAHADNYVLPIAPDADLGKDVIDCLRFHMNQAAKLALVFYSYDHLAAFKTQAFIQVPWDPHVFQYGSECDAYGRLRTADYAVKACKVHHSYDMKRVLDIKDTDSWEKVKQMLDDEMNEQTSKIKRNDWRELSMSQKEQDWRRAMKESSRAYLADKWGQLTCKVRNMPCSKPWPYCPTCPPEIPDCFKKNPTREELELTLTEAKKVFDSDPNQPLPFQG